MAVELMGGYNRLILAVKLTLLYKLLFILRRVEIQMDHTYETSEQVLKQIVKLINIERLYLSIYVLLTVGVLAFSV